MNTQKTIIKNSFWNFLVSLFNRIGALIFTIILARFLQPEGYGLYSLVLSIAMLFYTFSDLGVNLSFVRYLSDSLKRNKKKIPEYHRFLLKLKLVLSSGSALLLIILAYPLSFFIFKNEALFLPLIASAFYIFALSFDSFYSQPFSAKEKFNYSTVKEFIYQVLRISSALGVFYLFSVSYHLIGIFLSLFLNSLLLIFFNIFFSRKLIPTLFQKSANTINKKRLLKFIFFLGLASISSAFFSYTDILILGIFVSPAYVGYYRAAFSLLLGIWGFLAFPIPVLLPVLTKLGKNISFVLEKLFFYLSMFIIPAMFGIILFGKPLLNLIYGELYSKSAIPLYFLTILTFPAILIGLLLQTFTAKEETKLLAKSILFAIVLNIILDLILVPSLLKISELYSLLGAAIATVISWYFYFAICLFYLKKEFKISFKFRKLIPQILASIVMSVALYLLLRISLPLSLIKLVLYAFLGVLIYFVFLWLFRGIKKEEILLLKRLLISR